MAETMDEITIDESYNDSFTPNWISSLPRNIDEPLSLAIALSVDTLVRVERLLNIKAIFWPDSAPIKDLGIEFDFMDTLCEWAFRTRVVSSAELRSAIDRKCRGAKGDVVGVVVGVE